MKKKSDFKFSSLLNNYSIKLFFKGAIIPSVLSICIILVYVLKGNVDINLIEYVLDLILNIIPSLLGFVLSGYAILIGCSNFEILAVKKDNDKVTLYQKISVVFAIGLLMQIILLALTFFLKIILKSNIVCIFNNFSICNAINYLVFFIICFCSFYVLLMIKDLIMNIFYISQAYQRIINKKNDNNKN